MPINSKAKGKRGELSLVHRLKDAGYDVRRTAQYCGNTGDASDITGLEYIHPEVKNTERLSLYDAMSQAIHDSKETKKMPAVFHKRNNCEWLVIMEIDDWLKLYGEYYNAKKSEEMGLE